MGRIIRIRRGIGLQGAAVAYDVCIDGYKQAEVRCGQTVEIPIDSRPHIVAMALRGKMHQSVSIPEGMNGFGFVVQHKMTLMTTIITLVQECVIPGTPDAVSAPDTRQMANDFDRFQEQVADAMVQMTRTGGFKDLMYAKNNRRPSVILELYRDRIEVGYNVENYNSIKDWATGKHMDKYSYQQMGITPPAEWPQYGLQSLERLVRDRIERDTDYAFNQYGEIEVNDHRSIF